MNLIKRARLIELARIERDLKPWLYIKTDVVVRWLGKLLKEKNK